MTNSQIDKLLQLERLRSQIIEEMYLERKRPVWFYPEYRSVLGWQGTQDIMFVALAPSTGVFPSQDDDFFYLMLWAVGFHEAHLTDALKCRVKGKDVEALLGDQDLEKKQKEYLEREIAILSPSLIVPLGVKSRKRLEKWDIPFDVTLPHYVQQPSTEDTRRAFQRKLEDIHVHYAAGHSPAPHG